MEGKIMFSYHNDYRSDKAYRVEKIREVENDRLVEVARVFSSRRSLSMGRRTVISILCIAGLIVFGLVSPLTAHAQDVSVTASGSEAFYYAEAMTAYSMGRFYFAQEKYERAVAEYTDAIEGIPQEVFEAVPLYANLYWDLGEAQFMAGQHADALVSYQTYLELVGENVGAEAVEYVQQLELAVTNDTVAEVTLISG
jgi:tetratricopeptide (TPR) repeat protein